MIREIQSEAGRLCYLEPHQRLEASATLALCFAALGAALADFVAGIALAYHIDAAAAAHYLAIWVAKFQGTDRRNDFHGYTPSTFALIRKC